MRRSRRFQQGHTLLEMLISMVSAALVITGGLLLFLGGIRVGTQTQANSQALRLGSTSVDRLRLELAEATAFIVPDQEQVDDSDKDSGKGNDKTWTSSRLGSVSSYNTQNPNNSAQKLKTAVYVTLPAPLNMNIRTGATQTQTLALPSRRRINNGLLLYRGDSSGSPAPSSGTYLWAWRYENGVNTTRVPLYRRLSSQWDAVAFRRDPGQSNILRYRLVHAEKDSSNKERTQFGKSSGETLESSDYAIALVNYAGGSVPLSALPSSGGSNKP